MACVVYIYVVDLPKKPFLYMVYIGYGLYQCEDLERKITVVQVLAVAFLMFSLTPNLSLNSSHFPKLSFNKHSLSRRTRLYRIQPYLVHRTYPFKFQLFIPAWFTVVGFF